MFPKALDQHKFLIDKLTGIPEEYLNAGEGKSDAFLLTPRVKDIHLYVAIVTPEGVFVGIHGDLYKNHFYWFGKTGEDRKLTFTETGVCDTAAHLMHRFFRSPKYAEDTDKVRYQFQAKIPYIESLYEERKGKFDYLVGRTY